MKVYITEKSSQVKSLNEALRTIMSPNDFIIVPLSGHIMKLKTPDLYPDGLTKSWISDYENNKLPFVPKKWEKVVMKEKSNLYKNVKDAISKCKEIILAPDPDNEGVTLVMEVVENLGATKKVSGMINMSKLDLPSLKKEILSINKIPWERMFKAGEARSYLDWIYGMNGTVASTVILGNHFKKNGDKSTLHIGGVKLPTLRMVVERDEQFEKFKNIPFWKIEGIATKDGKDFKILFEFNGESKLDKEELAKSIVEDLKNGKLKGVVEKYDESNKKSSPPKPLSLTNLQSQRSSKFKYSLDQTLKIAQSLYDQKFQSYPRTDNNYYSEGSYSEVGQIMSMVSTIDDFYKSIVSKIQVPYIKRDIFDDKKVTAHTALSPTTLAPRNFKKEDWNIYKLVLNRFLIQFMEDYKYISIKGEAKTLIDNLKIKFSENISTSLGWKELEKDDNKKDDEEEDVTVRTIPKMNIGDDFLIKSIEIKKGETKPKPRFTEGSLAVTMEKISNHYDDPEIKKHLKENGIGQPSTRSNIIKELFLGGYFEYEGSSKKVKSTLKGRELIKLLPEEMSNPILRAGLESDLKEILRSKLEPSDVVEKITNFVKEQIKKLEIVAKNNNIPIQTKKIDFLDTGIVCPKCKSGNLVSNDKIYKCSNGIYNFKTKKLTGCDFVLFIKNKSFKNDEMTLEDVKDLVNNKTLNYNGNTISLDVNEKYGLKIQWKEGFSNSTRNSDGVIEFSKGFKKLIGGKEVVIWKSFLGKTFTLKQATSLFNGEKILISGFTSKRGKKFDRFVFLQGEKIELEFPKK